MQVTCVDFTCYFELLIIYIHIYLNSYNINFRRGEENKAGLYILQNTMVVEGGWLLGGKIENLGCGEK